MVSSWGFFRLYFRKERVYTMTQGRKALPTNIKVVKGTVRKNRVNKDEPKPKSDDVSMPDTLSDKAEKCWKQVSDHLKEAGLLTNVDQNALVMYCETFAKWQEANDMVTKKGPLHKTPNGHIQPSPFISIANKYFNQCKSMMTEFGMTPSSRSGISSSKGKDSESDPWSDM